MCNGTGTQKIFSQFTERYRPAVRMEELKLNVFRSFRHGASIYDGRRVSAVRPES